MKHAYDRLKGQGRWLPTPSIVLAVAALFVVLGGSAVAANGLIHAGDIAPGAVTSQAIRTGAVEPRNLSAATRALFGGGSSQTGPKGDPGSSGAAGSNGANGPSGVDGANGASGVAGTNGTGGSNGVNGANGTNGVDGTNGANGANGPNGANGTNGIDGRNGADGSDGADGTDGVNGTNGANGTITPLSAKQGATALPTGSPATTVVELTVPAGNYVVFAKTQLSHTGAGDTVECFLKSGATTLDQIAMKTLPALAAIPASLQAVTTTTSSTQLSVQCNVAVANGAANFSSLIAIPTA
ncbi:MAG: hypothetical protein ABW065_02485 [Solirubrobacterales bacterium]